MTDPLQFIYGTYHFHAFFNQLFQDYMACRCILHSSYQSPAQWKRKDVRNGCRRVGSDSVGKNVQFKGDMDSGCSDAARVTKTDSLTCTSNVRAAQARRIATVTMCIRRASIESPSTRKLFS